MVEISRRHVIAAATAVVAAMPGAPIAEVADPSAAVVVPYSEISIGQTLQIWQSGLPYIRGAVMRSGDWWYICEPLSAMSAAESGDDIVYIVRC
jgi:hypothetical protein